MALATSNLLAAIVAPGAANLGPFDRLAVEVADARACRPAFGQAQLASQAPLELRPSAVVTPVPEVVVHALPGREIMGQAAPGTALTVEVEQGIEDFADVGLPWAAARPGGRNQRLEQRPLRVSQITRIGFAFHDQLYAFIPFWNSLSVQTVIQRRGSCKAPQSICLVLLDDWVDQITG